MFLKLFRQNMGRRFQMISRVTKGKQTHTPSSFNNSFIQSSFAQSSHLTKSFGPVNMSSFIENFEIDPNEKQEVPENGCPRVRLKENENFLLYKAERGPVENFLG